MTFEIEQCQRITYSSFETAWSGGRDLIVKDGRGQQLAVFPLEFLESGHVNTYSFVESTMRMMYACEGDSLTSSDGQVLPSDKQVEAGEVFMPNCQGQVDALKGPRFKYKYRAPSPSGDTSTMSDSKRSSVNQRKFWEALLSRDGLCLLTNMAYHRCTAAHILPMSRPGYYTEVFGREPSNLFHPSYGLLLRDDLHHAFDRGDFALYPLDEDTLVVHFFNPGHESDTALHGKIIPREHFRGSRAVHPNHALLMFHYQQCAMMHFRGFSAGF